MITKGGLEPIYITLTPLYFSALSSFPPPTGMNQKTWPPANSDSDGSARFSTFPFKRKQTHLQNRSTENPFSSHSKNVTTTTPSSPSKSKSSSSSSNNLYNQDYSQLPYDVLLRIAATFTPSDVRAASLACKSWCDALRPLRESMVFLRWGKGFKLGTGGVKRNFGKALDSFLKGADRGSTLAMVDAGLLYWELGKRQEGISWYRKAAELGDLVGQCNLGISLLQGIHIVPLSFFFFCLTVINSDDQ